MPPIHFKRYANRFVPEELSEQQLSQLSQLPSLSSSQTRIDMFGQEVPRLKSGPFYWKMAYKLNHPQYCHVKEEMQKRRQVPVEQVPYVTFTKAC